jgi:hypothetical protein
VQHHKRVHARLWRAMAKRSAALQTRDLRKLRVRMRRDRDDPGPAVHHAVLHRIRERLRTFCFVMAGQGQPGRRGGRREIPKMIVTINETTT